MKSSIYISSEKIEVIGFTKAGKGVPVKTHVSCPLPEGTVINGKIIDHGSLVECLAGLRRQNPGLLTSPALMVDGSSILTKRISAPKLRKLQYYQLVKDEFADTSESFEEVVCGYRAINGNGAILACAADRAQVEDYVSTFKSAGIQLKAIRIGVQALLHYVSLQPEWQKETFVLNVIDGVTQLSMIFENGVNVFMSRTRLYSEEYEQLMQDILGNLSGLIQFNRSEKFNNISASYYLGLDEKDLAFMNAVNPYADIKLELPDAFKGTGGGAKLPSGAHFAYLNTMLGEDSIDLIQSCRVLDKLKKKQRPKRVWIPLAAVLLAVLALLTGWVYNLTVGVDRQVAELKAFLESAEVRDKEAELNRISADAGRCNDILRQHDAKMALEDGMTVVSSQVLDLITKTHRENVSISQFGFDESLNAVRVNGRCPDETDAASYIDALKTSDLVKSVRYTGYSYDNDGVYIFSIDVTLSGEEAAS